MEVTGFPTSCDIYLELEGKKVAVVQRLHRQSHQKQPGGGGLR